jgi:ATP-binding cassette subfamily F protein uup
MPDFDGELTILQQIFSSSNQIVEAVKEYEEACLGTDSQRLDKAMAQMEALNGWDYEVKVKQVLSQLNIRDLKQQIKYLSGGQKKRLALANVLISEPDILILDEPTNHLDLEMIEWLESFLKQSKSTLLMVTHDRYFLDRVCDTIYELEDKRLFRYKGNYSYFLEKREERVHNENVEIDKARALFKRELEWINRTPSARTTKARYRVDAFEDIKEVAGRRKHKGGVNMEVHSARLGRKIMEINGLSKRFDDLVILNDFSYTFNRAEKIGIIGSNGSGKSTFLNLITERLAKDSGKIDIGSTVVFGYYTQDGIQFDENKKVIDVITEIAEEIDMGDGKKLSPLQFLNYFMFPPKVQHNYVYKLSGGEKRRLYLMTVLMKNPNFLILDEPTNDLDIMTLNVLEDYLSRFQGCVVIVSHDRFFMDKLVDHLFVFSGNGKVKDFPGNYSQYRQWKVKQDAEAVKVQSNEQKKVKEDAEPKEKTKLTYKERIEFEQLTEEIEGLENNKHDLESKLSSGTLDGEEITKISIQLGELSKQIDEKSNRWLELSEFE